MGSSKRRTTRDESRSQRVLRLARAHPDWTVIRVAGEAGCSEANARKALGKAKIALSSQWRGRRRRGVTVLHVPPVHEFREVASVPSVEMYHGPVEEERPRLTWTGLRARAPTEPYVRLYRMFDSRRPPSVPNCWKSAIFELYRIEAEAVGNWRWFAGTEPRQDPPEVYDEIPESLWDRLVRANFVLAEIEKKTGGAYAHRVVPEGAAELVDAILGIADGKLDETVKVVWTEFHIASRRLASGESEDQGIEEVLLAMAPVIREVALQGVATSMADRAMDKVGPELKKRLIRLRVLSSLGASGSAREPSDHSGGGTGPDYVRRNAIIAMLQRDLGPHCSISDSGINGESLLVRIGALAEEGPWAWAESVRRHGIDTARIRSRGLRAREEVATGLLDRVEQLTPLLNQNEPALLKALIPLAAEATALPLHSLPEEKQSVADTPFPGGYGDRLSHVTATECRRNRRLT